MGTCIIDRATGLPLKLNRSRYLSLTVTTASGQVVEQDKRVETTIQTFPNNRGPVVAVPPQQRQMAAPPFVQGGAAASGIIQASGTQPQQNGVSTIPTGPAGPDTSQLKSTATAVYPD